VQERDLKWDIGKEESEKRSKRGEKEKKER
jgi:hypothetical protein